VQVRLLLGPAGSGKTFRCLAELREALAASPDGAPLLLIAPRQTTYQLERQLLADDSSVRGYTRLHILSFERLAHFIFERVQKAEPRMLDEEGRVMVLRGILAKKRDELKLFRASARLTGFAQQLSTVLRELQRNQLTPERIGQLAVEAGDAEGLGHKLHDLAMLLESYLEWLRSHNLQDADSLLDAAAAELRRDSRIQTSQEAIGQPTFTSRKPLNKTRKAENKRQLEFALTLDSSSQASSAVIADEEPSIAFKPISTSLQSLGIGGLRVDGFSEWSAQELDLLAALIPHCNSATLTFCLEAVPSQKHSWLSNWSVPQQSFERCKKRLAELPGVEVAVEVINRDPRQTRFVNNPILQQLEAEWPKSEKHTTFHEALAGGSSGTPHPNPLPIGWGEGEDRRIRVDGFDAGAKQKQALHEPPMQHAAPTELGTGSGDIGNYRHGAPTELSTAAHGHNAFPNVGVFPELSDGGTIARTLRVGACSNAEAEATLAAREILRHVRKGGRYRDVTVLVRKLENYHQVLQRIFTRYEIPYFLDRRELVSHHPLAELTRNALRTITFHWQRDDWFAALKTGLLGVDEREIDELENEALARGWKGAAWHEPIRFKDSPKSENERERLAQLESRLEQLRKQIMPAFQKLALLLGAEQNKPSGPKLAAALREFWRISNIEQRLEQWASGDGLGSDSRTPNSVHATVWSQMNRWLDNIAMAFPDERLPLRECSRSWTPVWQTSQSG
jgi:ATP-dependent helicase/DNAse subunit B